MERVSGYLPSSTCLSNAPTVSTFCPSTWKRHNDGWRITCTGTLNLPRCAHKSTKTNTDETSIPHVTAEKLCNVTWQTQTETGPFLLCSLFNLSTFFRARHNASTSLHQRNKTHPTSRPIYTVAFSHSFLFIFCFFYFTLSSSSLEHSSSTFLHLHMFSSAVLCFSNSLLPMQNFPFIFKILYPSFTTNLFSFNIDLRAAGCHCRRVRDGG